MSKESKYKIVSIIKNIFYKILNGINALHLYTTKSEALFKAVMIAISWAGGVWKQNTPIAYYLFSISIIMEYAVQLVTAKKFFPKFLPLILILSNAIVLLISTNQILNGASNYNCQYSIELLTIIIIAADAIVTILIEPPNDKIETSLKDV